MAVAVVANAANTSITATNPFRTMVLLRYYCRVLPSRCACARFLSAMLPAGLLSGYGPKPGGLWGSGGFESRELWI